MNESTALLCCSGRHGSRVLGRCSLLCGLLLTAHPPRRTIGAPSYFSGEPGDARARRPSQEAVRAPAQRRATVAGGATNLSSHTPVVDEAHPRAKDVHNQADEQENGHAGTIFLAKLQERTNPDKPITTAGDDQPERTMNRRASTSVLERARLRRLELESRASVQSTPWISESLEQREVERECACSPPSSSFGRIA